MHLFIQLALCCLLAFPLVAANSPIPNYEVGDTAKATITTPIPLIVVDQQKTEMLRQQEAARVQAIFRYYPKVMDEAENNLRTAFDGMREKFQNLLQTNFNKRVLGTQALAQARFQRFHSNFQKQNKNFPLTVDLVHLWASGESDAAIQTEYAAKLRTVMSGYIRPDSLPPAGKVGPWNGRVVALPSPGYVLDLETAEKQSFLLNKTNFVALNKARKEFVSSFPSNEVNVARFIASFIKENLVLDEELTAQARSRRTEAIWAADNYDVGQVLVSSNESVTPRIKAALDQLREKTAADTAKAEAAEQKLQAHAKAARFQEQALLAKAEADAASERNTWIAIGAGALAIVVLLGVLLRFKKRPAQSHALVPMPLVSTQVHVPLLPTTEGSMVVSSSAAPSVVTSAETDHWKERAIEAELKAEQLSTVVKAGLFPQLSRWLAQKFVRRLVLERKELMETQRRAELAIVEMETRLHEIRAPLEERLRAYEERIQELERKLAAKNEENQELIKATILAARRKLEEERSNSKNLLEFN